MPIAAPQPLAEHHRIAGFSSGVASLDDWLQRRARGNQTSGASRTFVISEGDDVTAFYSLASGSATAAGATGRFRRNMPDPIPVVVLGRLAVHHAFQGRGLGRALFRDAGSRVVQAAEAIGIRGILVNAVSAEARAFYISLGMSPSELNPMTLMVTLADLRENL